MNYYKTLDIEIMEDFLDLMNKEDLYVSIIDNTYSRIFLQKEAQEFFSSYYAAINDNLKLRILKIYPHIIRDLSYKYMRVHHEFSLLFMKELIKKDIYNAIYFESLPRTISKILVLEKNKKKYHKGPLAKKMYQSIVCSYRTDKNIVLKYLKDCWTEDSKVNWVIMTTILNRRNDIDAHFLAELMKILPKEYHGAIESHREYKGVAHMILGVLEAIDE